MKNSEWALSNTTTFGAPSPSNCVTISPSSPMVSGATRLIGGLWKVTRQ
jgi:hypothetical protein